MKFLRSRAAIIIIIAISILCLIAVGISVKISIITFERRNQVIRSASGDTTDRTGPAAKLINTNKVLPQIFYFNGIRVDETDAFITNKKDLLIPIDAVLGKLGIEFKYFSSDDVMEADVNGKKLTIKLGENSFVLDGDRIYTTTSSIAAKDHILVPMELFSYLDGFSVQGGEDKKTVFMNYHPAYNTDAHSKIKLLRYINDVAKITNIEGDKVYWESQFKNSDYKSAGFSIDNKYFYWVDEKEQASYIYNLESGVTKELGDYFFRIAPNSEEDKLAYEGNTLYEYKQGTNYKRVVLTNRNYDGNYTFIERNDNVVVEGNMEFSPNRKKVLYHNKDKGYYTANADGTNIVFLGDYPEAEVKWVNNNRIMVSSPDEMTLISRGGMRKAEVSKVWRMVGQTPRGDVLFTKGSTLYCETKGEERRIMELPWTCDYVYASSIKGPFIVVLSDKKEGVYYATTKKIKNIAAKSLLLKDKNTHNEYHAGYKGSIISSPDNRSFAILQNEEGLLAVDIVSNDGTEHKKVVLNYQISDESKSLKSTHTSKTSEKSKLNSKWISNNKLLICSQQKGWIVDIKDEIKIYDWAEQKDSIIVGF